MTGIERFQFPGEDDVAFAFRLLQAGGVPSRLELLPSTRPRAAA
jgi:hypothetical protein